MATVSTAAALCGNSIVKDTVVGEEEEETSRQAQKGHTLGLGYSVSFQLERYTKPGL